MWSPGFSEEVPKVGEPIAAGDIRADTGVYGVVIYYAPKPRADTKATAKELARQFLPHAEFSDANLTLKAPYVGFEEEQAPLKNYLVPTASYFKHAGRGLTDADIEAFQKTECATQIVMVVPKADVWSSGRKFTELVLAFAEKTGGYVWDSATRECFSREAWKERRLVPWAEEGVTDVSRQMTIHLYRSSDTTSYLRAVTLGMEKFALPDVVIEQLIGSDNRPAGNLINFVCQTFAENPIVKDGAKEQFKLESLQAEGMRTKMVESLEKGAHRETTLALLNGRRDEGDPENRLIEISFRHGSGAAADERRDSVLSYLWGKRDAIVEVKHSDEIKQASARAKKRLVQIRADYEKGLEPGSRLLVKSPFVRDDEGQEWMWVEVMRWPAGESLDGVLQNDPFYIRALKAGARVKVKVADIFDFILYKADGTSEGNETGKLIEQQGGARKEK